MILNNYLQKILFKNKMKNKLEINIEVQINNFLIYQLNKIYKIKIVKNCRLNNKIAKN